VTPRQTERCRELVEEIDATAHLTGAYDEQRRWLSPGGGVIHQKPLSDEFAIDAEFLNSLRKRSIIFNGWPMIDDLAPPGAIGWFCRRAMKHLSSSAAERWSRAPLIGHHLGHMASHAPPLRWFMPLHRSYTIGLPREYVCDPPPICGEECVTIEGVKLNRDMVCYQERMTLLYRERLLETLKSKEAPVILEIGGGYGALAYFIRRVIPQAIYIIVDLPNSLALAACYLTLAQRSPVKIADGRAPSAGETALAVASEHLTLPINKIDLAINTLSFSEMPENTVERYAKMIAEKLAPGGVLFEQNFDNADVQAETFCSCASVLARHFPQCHEIRGDYLKGTPRVWRKS
jgi:hypothetical protein